MKNNKLISRRIRLAKLCQRASLKFSPPSSMARIPLSCFFGQFGASTLQRWASVKSSIHEAAYSGDAELVPNNRSYDRAEDLNGVQHFLVRKGRDTHLECDARDAAENFIHIEDLFRDRLGVADQQRASRSAQGVELSTCGRGPAAFLADFRKGVCIAWKEYFRGFVRGVREKANGVKTYSKPLGGMSGAAPSLAVEVYERAEASRLTADNGNHERKSQHAGANERFGRAADADP